MKRPMIFCAAVCLIISFAAFYISYELSVMLSVAALCGFFVVLMFRKTRQFAVVLAVIFAVFVSLAVMHSTRILPASHLNKTDADIIGTVTDEVIGEQYKYYVITLDEKAGSINKGSRVKLYTDNVTLKVGEQVSLSARLTAQDAKKHKINFSNEIYISGYIKELHWKGRSESKIAALRGRIRNVIFDNLPYSGAATICALTVGDRGFHEGDFSAAVKNSGVSHVMVVSGMHMTVICGSIYSVFKLFKLQGRVAAVITAVITVMFMALCGFTASVTRSGLAYLIWLAGKFFCKPSDALNSLSVAVVAMVICNPYCMGNIGFLLSVSSTAGIIVLNPYFSKILRLEKLNKFLSGIITAVITTVSALIATLPITVYYFGYISTVAVFTNVLISSAVTAALICSFAAIVLSFLPFATVPATILFGITEILTGYFNRIIEYFGNLKYSTVNCSFIVICAVYFVVAFLAILKYTYIDKKIKRSV